jgi:2-keto-4-pentenoate hydratase/2-oxohepta-3-ene-1,7-dioic acid hydratase in catechol pathway
VELLAPIQFPPKIICLGLNYIDHAAETGSAVPEEPVIFINARYQLKNTSDLAIRTWVNGELRQNGNTRNMVFNVSQIVHQLSRVMTLEPCDIIATGTPAGVGFKMKPPMYLKDGDVVRIEIEGIGILENMIEEQA